ncbi:hypothetical protein JOF29_004638 [Kribbella aluminosa]|uniref:Uncharacterized protein n=1 Tax=Kribbella aluminosa TaxID=416017 RepID=A0ABS4UPG0_9ACTN|nr:hypothetical protein [Kribbella aluminosa]MBP2353528.1 hypothetical protein [Kribbella aluminosa]
MTDCPQEPYWTFPYFPAVITRSYVCSTVSETELASDCDTSSFAFAMTPPSSTEPPVEMVADAV